MKINKLPEFSNELTLIKIDDTKPKLHASYFEGGVKAGFPSPADDFKEQKLSLDERYLSKPNSTFFVRVDGDSMSGTFENGDLLIVRKDLEITHDCIAIVSVNHCDFTVKRVDLKNNTFIADNPNYPNITVSDDDNIIAFGVVKTFFRDL